jgi:hypothetical protein
MSPLTPVECRVLGVLVEKAQTTPQQYPLTLNALTNGCNQKNNRDPVTDYSEEQVLGAVDGLKARKLAHEVMLSGSRVAKYRHVAREALSASTSELVVLAELLLRGPQTLGELRGRASRMHPLESLEVTRNVLDSLRNRPEPLVRELPPTPGDRSPRFGQLLCPDLHPLDAPAPAAGGGGIMRASSGEPSADAQIGARMTRIEAEVAALRWAIARLASRLGEPDPFHEPS